MTTDGLTQYYAQRAAEYERIYHKPERQEDLKVLARMLKDLFRERAVLEIACGTGYWTQVIASSARSICATDYNTEVIEIAKQKAYGPCEIAFLQADAYDLANVAGRFDSGFSGFWWSHVPLRRFEEFFTAFHARLDDGALVVFMDNNYVENSSTPIARTDSDGNTYQIRTLDSGEQYEVLKNFPADEDIRRILAPVSTELSITQLTYFWLARYRVKKSVEF